MRKCGSKITHHIEWKWSDFFFFKPVLCSITGLRSHEGVWSRLPSSWNRPWKCYQVKSVSYHTTCRCTINLFLKRSQYLPMVVWLWVEQISCPEDTFHPAFFLKGCLCFYHILYYANQSSTGFSPSVFHISERKVEFRSSWACSDRALFH